ncbi:hypothetical protein VTO73DRAFT_12132 [Trametes versicolor]
MQVVFADAWPSCARQCLAPPPSQLNGEPLRRSKQRIAMYIASGHAQFRILEIYLNPSTFRVLFHNQQLPRGGGNVRLSVDGGRGPSPPSLCFRSLCNFSCLHLRGPTRMPRFLNTWTGEFEWHPDPTQVTYVILSHVWREPKDGGEQSYDDVRKIQQEVKEHRWVPASLDSNTNAGSDTSMAWAPFAFISFEDIENEQYETIFAHPGLSDKIKGFCKVAREAGFRLAWNDTCCINKSSSAELSEAINSMYEWYRLSDMCYVYLADVYDGDVPQKYRSEFRESRWHRRGWTLQELIAPECIFFLTRTWRLLGTKMGLASTLERITGVDFDILVGRATLDSVSVARRMSWAAKRETTRVEDRAYSLFGIFGLHMSPIYGEGENAFLRLQEEIVRTIPDQSIFAWGNKYTLRFSDVGGWSVERYGWLQTDDGRGLLTTSPTSFSECSDITSIASSFFAQTLRIQESRVPPVHCIFTPEGVKIGALMTLLEREHVLPTVEDVTLLRHHSGPSVPKSLQKREGLFGYGNASFLYRMIRSTVFQISPHSMDALGTLGIVTSPVQVTRSDWEEIVLETTLEFHGAGTTYVVALRLSLRDYFGWEMAACFSAGRVGVIGSGSGQSFIGTAASHHAVGNTPRIPGTFLDLENYGYISTNMHSHFHNFFRPTYISTEITVGSGAVWGGSARLLRIALQHPFATPFTEEECPSHFWLSIDISEEHPYVSRTESATDSPSSGPAHPEATPPSDGSGQRDQESSGDTGAQHVGWESNPCRCENATLRAEIEQLKKRNAELASRIDAVVARLDASTASSGASSLRRYAEQLAVR